MIRIEELIVISWDDVMMSAGSEEGWVLCATVECSTVVLPSSWSELKYSLNSEIRTVFSTRTHRDLKTCQLQWKWIHLLPKQQAQNKTSPDLKSKRYADLFKVSYGALV